MVIVPLHMSIRVFFKVTRKFKRANLGFGEHILHTVDWAIRDPTSFKETKPLGGYFFCKPRCRQIACFTI